MDVWVRLVDTDVGGRPLAACRLLFAAAAAVLLRSSWRRFDTGFDADRIHVPWPVVSDVFVALPPAVPVALWVVGIGLLVTGVAARVGAAAVAAGMILFYGVDRAHYANGGYFMVLIALLLVMADSGASRTPWGPDRRRAPWWPTFLLAAQLSIVYGYAAVQKFRSSSLRGDTIRWQLHGPLSDAIGWSQLAQALNLAGGLAEVFCAIGLWFAATRKLAAGVGVVLHLGVVAFVRNSPDLWAFGLASVSLYPAFWLASPPLADAWRSRRARTSVAT